MSLDRTAFSWGGYSGDGSSFGRKETALLVKRHPAGEQIEGMRYRTRNHDSTLKVG